VATGWLSARAFSFVVGILVAALTAVTPADAQVRRPRADVTPTVFTDAPRAGEVLELGVRVRLDRTLHVQSNTPRDPSLLPTVLTIDAPPGLTVEAIEYPEAFDLEQEGAPEPLTVYGHDFEIRVRATLDAALRAGLLVVPARLRYQACDDKLCYAPATADVSWTVRVTGADGTPPPAGGEAPAAAGPGGAAAGTTSAGAADDPGADAAGLAALDGFILRATTGGYLGRDDFLTFIANAEAGVEQRGLLEGRGPLAILAIVFLGGLALNLTPCVLPMIPINLAIIGAGAQAGSRRRGLLLGMSYGAAMAIVYGVLGLVVILTAGTFGTLNASPWFNLAIAIVFVVLGLAMFDVILIDFSRFAPSSVSAGGKGSVALAFSMGAIAAILAGACVAPVVIQVVVFASNLYASGTSIALALPFVLGLGMALPWPLAGAGIGALPRPGRWMVRVKQAFGVIILATAVYYGYLAYTLFANRWVDPAAVQASMEEKLASGWYASLPAGLEVAAREGRPVLVDLWATWCKNCLTMDSTTLADPEVLAALDRYVKIKVQAEDPDEPATRATMQRFGAVGLPTYVILEPANAVP
jgi:thiol:disulfide interchange protein DsbD